MIYNKEPRNIKELGYGLQCLDVQVPMSQAFSNMIAHEHTICCYPFVFY